MDYKIYFWSLLRFSKDLEILRSEVCVSDWQWVSDKLQRFVDFQAAITLYFWTELELWSKENLWSNYRATSFVFKVLSKSKCILKYRALIFGNLCLNFVSVKCFEFDWNLVAFFSIFFHRTWQSVKRKVGGFLML